MPGSSSWMPYGPQGLKGFDDDDDDIAEKLGEQERRGQEIPQRLICRNSWRPF